MHSVDIPDFSLNEILGHEGTKWDLSIYFMEGLRLSLEQRRIEYLIAGNGRIYKSNSANFDVNNHEEADSLLIYCMTELNLDNQEVVIYSNDTDVFILLVAHPVEVVNI